MDAHDVQQIVTAYANELSLLFQKIPGSAIFLRYVRSSYQNDPVRSVFEAFLFLFAVRYLLSPKYSTQKEKNVKLTEEVWSLHQTGCVVFCINMRCRRLTIWWTIGSPNP